MRGRERERTCGDMTVVNLRSIIAPVHNHRAKLTVYLHQKRELLHSAGYTFVHLFNMITKIMFY